MPRNLNISDYRKYWLLIVLLCIIFGIALSWVVPGFFWIHPAHAQISTIPPQWLEYDPRIDTMISQVDESKIYQTTYDLQNFSTRVNPSPGNRQAASYLYHRLENIPGLETEYQGGTYQNIIATLPGRNTSSDKVFIVGAHYDTTSSDPDHAPGSTDNGCGVAIVLELARIMSQYKFNNTIKFALWNSEETGRQGSSDYATYAAQNSLNIPLYFNFDSSCYDPDNQYVLDIMYDEESAPIAEVLTEYNSLYNINFTLTYNVHNCNSDYTSFRKFGYPTIMTHSQSHGSQAHTPNDTIDMMSPEFARKNAQLGMSVVARLLEIQPDYYEGYGPVPALLKDRGGNRSSFPFVTDEGHT